MEITRELETARYHLERYLTRSPQALLSEALTKLVSTLTSALSSSFSKTPFPFETK